LNLTLKLRISNPYAKDKILAGYSLSKVFFANMPTPKPRSSKDRTPSSTEESSSSNAPVLLCRHKEAVRLLTSKEIVKHCERAKWIKACVRRHKLTLYPMEQVQIAALRLLNGEYPLDS
jgi:hypothetical protein